jgi:hypothetical protein
MQLVPPLYRSQVRFCQMQTLDLARLRGIALYAASASASSQRHCLLQYLLPHLLSFWKKLEDVGCALLREIAFHGHALDHGAPTLDCGFIIGPGPDVAGATRCPRWRRVPRTTMRRIPLRDTRGILGHRETVHAGLSFVRNPRLHSIRRAADVILSFRLAKLRLSSPHVCSSAGERGPRSHRGMSNCDVPARSPQKP